MCMSFIFIVWYKQNLEALEPNDIELNNHVETPDSSFLIQTPLTPFLHKYTQPHMKKSEASQFFACAWPCTAIIIRLSV